MGKRGEGRSRVMTSFIEVSAADFARMNKGLITVLKAVRAAGKGGISTRKLYNKIGMIGHGAKLVDRAEREGYIRREWREPEGKGAWLRVNYITPRGKDLLRKISA
jgi:hypothetical protein